VAEFTKVAKAAEIAPGASRVIEGGGRSILLVNLDGAFHAINNTCTHAGAPLSEGEISGCQVICPWHSAVFDIKTGRALKRPATKSTWSYRVRVVGEDVEIEF
jgi:nitrite reductase/ring-hydroxylating ferredoxin subunit